MVAALGEPRRTLSQNGQQILVYTRERAVPGTTEVQVFLRANGLVEQIVVFPAAPVGAAEVEASYGKECRRGKGASTRGCYRKVLSESDFRTCWHYRSEGLRVFLTLDKKAAHSFVFTASAAQSRSRAVPASQSTPAAPREAESPELPAAPAEPEVPAAAVAPEEPEAPLEGEAASDPFFRPEVRGFLESQLLYLEADEQAGLYGLWPLPARERGRVRLNVQPQLRTRGELVGASADLSIFLATDSPKLLLLADEFSVDARLGRLRLLAGRKRVVWGSGLVANPTDVINPAKDPLDPAAQRTGAFLLPMVDYSLGAVTVSALVSPAQAANRRGLPDQLDFGAATYGVRLYGLLGGFDLNAIYFRDQGRERNLFGLAASGFLGTVVELHLEALGRSGESELPALPVVPGCGAPLTPANDDYSLSAVAGTRLHLESQSVATVEYVYDSNGLNGSNFDRFRDQLPCAAQALAMMPAAAPAAADPLGVPVEPSFLVRSHHLFFHYLRPHLTPSLLEDVQGSAALLFSPLDASGILQAELGYDFGGRALVSGRLSWWFGGKDSEAGLSPERLLGSVTLRISY